MAIPQLGGLHHRYELALQRNAIAADGISARDKVTAGGGDAQMMSLPAMGIKGNSHMLMQDKNNLQLTDLILAWIDSHVEKKAVKGN